MSRIGKIARLPEEIRQQINVRLQDGENGRQIIDWLNSTDAVKAALAEGGFEDQEIIDSNLSHWRSGGYRDWEMQQATMDEARRIAAEGSELGQVTENGLADKLALWLTGRYVVATRKLVENADDPAAWKMLRELSHDLAVMRRGNQGGEWVRLERERLEFQRQRNERDHTKTKRESGEDEGLPPMDAEEKERRYRQIFGMEPI